MEICGPFLQLLTPVSKLLLSAIQRGGINTENGCRLIDRPGVSDHSSHMFVREFFKSHTAPDSKFGSHLDDLRKVVSTDLNSASENNGALD
jgi:hypothetical protein